MTRKDYVLIAQAIAGTKEHATSGESLRMFHAMTSAIATALEATNPNFDRSRFINAASPKETTQ